MPMSQKLSYWPSLILQIRKSMRLSQEDLAEMLDTNQATISRWERGNIIPSYDKQRIIERIASNEDITSLGGMVELVRNSPSRIFIIDQEYFVIASSSSSEWNENTNVQSQLSTNAKAHFSIVSTALIESGFWNGLGGIVINYDYHYNSVNWHSVITSVLIRGRIYAVIQQTVTQQP